MNAHLALPPVTNHSINNTKCIAYTYEYTLRDRLDRAEETQATSSVLLFEDVSD